MAFLIVDLVTYLSDAAHINTGDNDGRVPTHAEAVSFMLPFLQSDGPRRCPVMFGREDSYWTQVGKEVLYFMLAKVGKGQG